jgi:hypothetical protein
VEGAKVATNPNEAATGLGPDGEELEPGAEEQQPNPEVNDQEQGGEDEGGETPVVETAEDVARKIGWVPKDEFKGNPDDWKPATDFIISGRDIQRGYATELKGLRSQIDVMARTTADIVKDRLEAQRAELTGRYNELVEEGNAAEAFKVSQRLLDIDRRVASPPPGAPPPEVADFVERNKTWYDVDPAATLRAREVSDKLAARGASVADQLQAAERIVRTEFPDLFQGQRNGQRAAPSVHRPGSRSAAPSNKAKTFADLPPDNQKVARMMVENGSIPDVEAYSKYYWKNAEGKR